MSDLEKHGPNCEINTRVFYVDSFIKYMDRHPIQARVMVITFCASFFYGVVCVSTALVIMAAKSVLNLTDIVKTLI